MCKLYCFKGIFTWSDLQINLEKLQIKVADLIENYIFIRLAKSAEFQFCTAFARPREDSLLMAYFMHIFDDPT